MIAAFDDDTIECASMNGNLWDVLRLALGWLALTSPLVAIISLCVGFVVWRRKILRRGGMCLLIAGLLILIPTIVLTIHDVLVSSKYPGEGQFLEWTTLFALLLPVAMGQACGLVAILVYLVLRRRRLRNQSHAAGDN